MDVDVEGMEEEGIIIVLVLENAMVEAPSIPLQNKQISGGSVCPSGAFYRHFLKDQRFPAGLPSCPYFTKVVWLW